MLVAATLAATEDAIQQRTAAALLAAATTLAVATVVATARWINTTTGIRIAATGVIVATFVAGMAAEEVQQGPAAALLTATVALACATIITTTGRVDPATGICRALVRAAIAGLLAARSAAQKIQQWSSAVLGAATALGRATVVMAATGSGIHIRLATAGLRGTAVVVHTEHSVEQVESEALGAQA